MANFYHIYLLSMAISAGSLIFLLCTSCAESIPVSNNGSVNKPDWAANFGWDQYGTWADIEIFGVQQRMRWIKPGSYTMGCSHQEDQWALKWIASSGDTRIKRSDLFHSEPHRVTISFGFWMADTTCTKRMWEAVLLQHTDDKKIPPSIPACYVSWNNIQIFTNKIQKSLNIKIDLPTEAQWEYACRAGTTTRFFFGDDPDLFGEFGSASTLEEYITNSGIVNASPVWDTSRHPRMWPVKSFKPNPWGLYDMCGNAYQWCRDWFDEYNVFYQIDPTGPSKGTNRVIRGGAWSLPVSLCRSAWRNAVNPNIGGDDLSFRFAIYQ